MKEDIRTEIRTGLQALFEQYMGQMTPTSAVGSSKVAPVEMSLDKRKGILGSIPLEALKEKMALATCIGLSVRILMA
ncbi:hypothetical protein J1N35_013649 [Gossypium stocksii]|uniref:Uncharacterized protein n=1 Tax=Gossypium stocksii TaxID=47602 RepID=A0A9D3VU34_9ROSI|nr:hypothetical protein J1N35_013649 [Gossypium stocksii]